jgi:excisionase family DNA binding protein
MIRKGKSMYNPNNNAVGTSMFHSPLLTRKQAAEYLGVTEHTLSVWKCTGRYSLTCIKVGRLVKYRKSDLDAFLERRTVGA